MRSKTAPLIAALLMAGTIGSLSPAEAQLPPVVMGKTVKQPGDNQYMPQAQLERHGNYVDRTGTNTPIFLKPQEVSGAATSPGAIQTGGMTINPMVLMWSNAPKVDISLEPIATDEPIPPANFPPLPDRIQLPISMAAGAGGPGGGGAGGAWNGGGGGGAGGGAGGGGGRRGGSAYEGMHQHYAHFTPGYTQAGGGGGGGGSAPSSGGGGYAADPNEAVPGAGRFGGGGGGEVASGGSVGGVAPPGGTVKSHGYYKCNTQASPMVLRDQGGDTFNANSGAGGAPPRYTGATKKDLDKLGRAPKLDDGQDDHAGAPEAPQAVMVSQSQAQDLSLPDDEFVSRQGLKDGAGKRAAKAAGRRTVQILQQGVNMGVSRAYGLVP